MISFSDSVVVTCGQRVVAKLIDTFSTLYEHVRRRELMTHKECDILML